MQLDYGCRKWQHQALGVVDFIALGTVLVPEDSPLVWCSDQVVGTSGTVVHQVMAAVDVETCGHVWNAAPTYRRFASGSYPDQ